MPWVSSLLWIAPILAGLEPGFLGFGVNQGPQGSVRIVAVYPEGPAHRAGLAVGDELLEVDGVDCSGQPLAAVLARLRGVSPGATVDLRLRRDGSELGARLTAVRRPDEIQRTIDRERTSGKVSTALPELFELLELADTFRATKVGGILWLALGPRFVHQHSASADLTALLERLAPVGVRLQALGAGQSLTFRLRHDRSTGRLEAALEDGDPAVEVPAPDGSVRPQ